MSEGMRRKNCGRITDHPEHMWAGVDYTDWTWKRVEFFCWGAPHTEGGQKCQDCPNPTANAGPRCLPCQRDWDELTAERNAEWWSTPSEEQP